MGTQGGHQDCPYENHYDMTEEVTLELRHVAKAFPMDGGSLLALADVSLQARRGEFVVLVGPSGCGKSTVLNIVAGLENPTRGEVYLFGRVEPYRLGKSGYMPQRDLLLPWRSTLDNVILGLEIRGMARTEARRRALALLPQFGLAGFEHAYPTALSGGMRQRAAFLRTVLPEHELLLLDEPFGALDALTRTLMQEWLLDRWRELRRTVLFVTHDVDEALFLADRVYVMSPRPGRIVAEIDVTLPRPRTRHTQATAAYGTLREHLLDLLLGPVRA